MLITTFLVYIESRKMQRECTRANYIVLIMLRAKIVPRAFHWNMGICVQRGLPTKRFVYIRLEFHRMNFRVNITNVWYHSYGHPTAVTSFGVKRISYDTHVIHTKYDMSEFSLCVCVCVCRGGGGGGGGVVWLKILMALRSFRTSNV